MKSISLFILLSLAACSSAETLGERTIVVPLTYDDGSNFGSMTATGTATINTLTGKVDIQVIGLPMLTEDEYEGWLAGGDESAISTAKFNTDASGLGSSTILLGDISETTYTRVVLTVEPKPDPSPKADSRHSIGGDIL